MARKLYKTPVIRCRGFWAFENAALHGATGGCSVHKPAGLKLRTARIRLLSMGPWLLGRFAYGPNLVALDVLMTPQTAKVFSTSLSSCEFHGDTESPMHAIALL